MRTGFPIWWQCSLWCYVISMSYCRCSPPSRMFWSSFDFSVCELLSLFHCLVLYLSEIFEFVYFFISSYFVVIFSSASFCLYMNCVLSKEVCSPTLSAISSGFPSVSLWFLCCWWTTYFHSFEFFSNPIGLCSHCVFSYFSHFLITLSSLFWTIAVMHHHAVSLPF